MPAHSSDDDGARAGAPSIKGWKGASLPRRSSFGSAGAGAPGAHLASNDALIREERDRAMADVTDKTRATISMTSKGQAVGDIVLRFFPDVAQAT